MFQEIWLHLQIANGKVNNYELKFKLKAKRRKQKKTYQVVNSSLFEVITCCFQLNIVYIWKEIFNKSIKKAFIEKKRAHTSKYGLFQYIYQIHFFVDYFCVINTVIIQINIKIRNVKYSVVLWLFFIFFRFSIKFLFKQLLRFSSLCSKSFVSIWIENK